MRTDEKSRLATYGFAVLCVSIAFAARILGWSVLGEESPFLFFFTALAIASWYGGFGPGLLATLLGALIVGRFFLPLFTHLRIFEGVHGMNLVLYVSTGTLISWLMGKLQSALRRSEEAEREMKQRAAEAEEGRQKLRLAHAELESRVEERTTELARANKELEAEKQRLFSVLDTLPFFVCLLDAGHSVHFGNRRFHALFPLAQGRPFPAAGCGNQDTRDGCPACRARETNSQVQWRWASPGGRFYEIYDTAFSAGGSDSLVLEIGIDVTERSMAEQALELERSKLLSILGLMREAVYIVSQQSELEYVNPAFEKEFGPAEQGRKCYEVLHARQDSCPWCRNAEVFAGKSITGEWTSPASGKVYDVFDAPIVHRDGSLSKLKILHDVTEHKRVQERLRYNEDLMRKMLETLPVGVWICDREGKIVSGNPRARQIWGGVRRVGIDQFGEYKGWWRGSGERIEASDWALARAIRKGVTSVNEEVEIEGFDGTRKIILNSAAPVLSDRGETVAAIAVNLDITELKRAEEERERQHRQLESLWRISRDAEQDIEHLYDRVLTEMLEMTESRYGFLGLLSEDEGTVTVRAWSPDAVKDCRVIDWSATRSIDTAGLWAEAVRSGHPMILNDYHKPHPSKKVLPEGHPTLNRLLVVPVLSRGRAVLVAAVANKPKVYTEEEAEQLRAFLTSVNAVVQKKAAEDALKHSERELRRLSSELLTAQETERMRISRELHDELGQAMILVKLRIGLVEMGLADNQEILKEHCRSAATHVDSVLEDMRRLARALCPAVLEDLGVTAALKRLVAESRKASKIRISAELEDIDHLFSPQQSILLYRVLQEMLTNIMKHSEASQVQIRAIKAHGHVAFHVQDDGKGIDLQEAEAEKDMSGRGLGLAFMRERVRTLGGHLELSSQKGAGTRLSFSVPVHDEGVQS